MQIVEGISEGQLYPVCFEFFFCPKNVTANFLFSRSGQFRFNLTICYKSFFDNLSYFVKGEYRLVRNFIAGNIFDSSPVDFTSDLGTRYALHPTIQKMPGSSKLASWVAKGIASGLDALYLTRFESQRTEYWQALYSSVVSFYLALST